MTPDASQAGDEEFEARLSWSPPQSTNTVLQPARRATAVELGRPISGAPVDAQTEEPLDRGPRLQDVRDDVAGVRAELANLRATVTRLRTEIATVQGLVVDLTSLIPAHPSAEDIDGLMKAMNLLRRRIGLRSPSAAGGLDEAALSRLSDAAQAWLAAQARSSPRSRRRWRRGG